MSEKKETKLYEVLAAEPHVKSEFNKRKSNVIELFKDKSSSFDGQRRTYTPLIEGGAEKSPEHKEVVASVTEELDYVFAAAIENIDIKLTKEATNTIASADLEVNGKIIAEAVPATGLLALESALTELREILKVIPTRNQGDVWKFNEDDKWWETEVVTSQATAKEKDWKVVAQATDKFPADVREVIKDVVLGNWLTKKTSGRISVVEKAALLHNLDNLIVAVTTARNRANAVAIKNIKLGEILVKEILGNVVDKSTEVNRSEIERTFKN